MQRQWLTFDKFWETTKPVDTKRVKVKKTRKKGNIVVLNALSQDTDEFFFVLLVHFFINEISIDCFYTIHTYTYHDIYYASYPQVSGVCP